MYKTVRQGDACLQYHILPQDDVTGHVTKRRRAPRHRTAFLLVLTLILGCAIVAAAVLVPVLASSNVVTLPARFQTFAVAASSVTGMKVGLSAGFMGHGRYTLQGAQYIALLPVKDPLGHLSYQLKPSIFTTTSTSTTTTTTTTTTATPPPKTSTLSPAAQVRSENNDPFRPLDHRSGAALVHRGELHRPRWAPDPYMPWMEHKGGALVLSLVVALVMLLAAATLGLCLYIRRRACSNRGDVERDRGTLLAEVSGDED